ncbi:hypothetical protein ACU686_35090 [Yinghuangia aomiensis]
MDTDEVTLVHHGFPKPKYVRLRVDGGSLRRESGSGSSAKPRHSAKDCGSPTEAGYALAKETNKRLRDGFVVLRDPAEAAVGEPVLVAAAPNRCGSQVLDVHPGGHTLVVGTMLKQAYGAEIHLVDVATGVRRLVHTEPAGERQTFLHTVRFDAAGQGVVYALNGQTRLLDLATGASRTLASYEQWQTSGLQPVLRPAVLGRGPAAAAGLRHGEPGPRPRPRRRSRAGTGRGTAARVPCRCPVAVGAAAGARVRAGPGARRGVGRRHRPAGAAARVSVPVPRRSRRSRVRRCGRARFRPDGAVPGRQRGVRRRPVRDGTRHRRLGVGSPRSAPHRPMGHLLRLGVLP